MKINVGRGVDIPLCYGKNSAVGAASTKGAPFYFTAYIGFHIQY